MNSPTKLLSRLRKPVAVHSFMTAPETINAFYTAVMNEIIIPLGILQAPFYQSSRPQVLNYGAIGFSIGHELSHAFDDNGRRYTVAGRPVSGENTLAENIADNAGIKAAFDGYFGR